jgi:hypothetical protein
VKQILHIFAKDTRHYWPEILLSVAITAAFAWIYPNWWIPDHLDGAFQHRDPFAREMKYLAAILVPLVYVGWCVLISRVIHGETLVGNRQFWLTRPYEWKKLLAAKLLFLLAFLYLPALIAQGMLLAEAGFNPSAYVPGVLYSLVLLTDLIALLFALSTITSNFARTALILVGIFLGLIVYRYLTVAHPRSHVTSVASPFGSIASFLIILCGCGTAAVLQYALRKLWLARLVLITTPVLLVTIGAVAGLIARSQTRMDRTYPPQIGEAAVLVPLSYHPSSNGSTLDTWRDTGEAGIHIPLVGSGVAPGYVAIPEAAKVAIDAPDGSHWTSVWQGARPGLSQTVREYLPGEEYNDAVFLMPRAVYDKLKLMPVTVHLTLALTLAKAGSVTRIPLPTREFSVPDFGICSPSPDYMRPPSQATVFLCRSALREPQLTHIDVVWSDTPCLAPHAEPDPGVRGAAWIGSLDREPVQGIAPVWTTTQPVDFSNAFKPEGINHSRYLCPGSPVTFTQYNLVRHTREAITIQGFLLGGVAAGHAPEWGRIKP